MHNKYGSLFSILLMAFIDYVSIGLVYPMFSSMLIGPNGNLLALGTSHSVRCLWLGFILALMPAAQFFSGPILGTLSDYVGRKKVMIVSVVFGVVGYAIAVMGVWCASILLLAFSRVIIGISAGNEAVGGAAIADLSTPEEKAKLFGLMGMAGGLGFTVGPLFGGILSCWNVGMFSGYMVPFVFAGLLCIMNLLAVIFLFKETFVAPRERSMVSFGLSNVKKAWVIPGFCLLLGTVFFYNFGYSSYWEFIPVFWIAKYNFNVGMVGNRLALGAAVYALSAGFLIRFLESRFKSENILFYAFIFGSIFLILPLFFSAPWLFWIYIPLQEGTIALIFPETSAIVSNRCPSNIQGEMMGVLQSVRSLALIVSPLIAGYLLGITVNMPMIVGATSFLFAAYLLSRSMKYSL